MPQTMFEKIWDRHVIVMRGENEALLHVDRNFVHEGSFHAFIALAVDGRKVRKPRQTFATADHYVPTRNRDQGMAAVTDPEMRNMLDLFAQNTKANDIRNYYGLEHPQQGIVHVLGPELGITQPGLIITCGDSHTSTHGAFGAYAIGIGASQLKQILATQCLWQKKPKTLRVTVDGVAPAGVTAKDIVLAIIAKIGTAGGIGCAIEFAGEAIRALSMEGRLTVCNMAIEAGARSGMIAPDEKTYAYLKGREFAPQGAHWEKALQFWRSLASDGDARFNREVTLDAATLAPMVTWGTSPEEAVSIATAVPDPASASDADKRSHMEQALRYMDLTPGTPLDGLKIHRAFIGTCTNGRIEDLRAAAAVLKGRKSLVPAWVSPGSSTVKRQAEAEGLDKIFIAAGFDWRASGCSSCAATNGDTVPAGERCASTSNRNFEGRQGKGARTHLMSPAMVAAAAVSGKLTDVRKLMQGA
jgi:3-isopropylmalate/(R)-2-methylmalate dehydratase large subunit